MFRKNKSGQPVPPGRIQHIAEAPPPQEYGAAETTATRPERKPVFRQGVAILPHGERLAVVLKSVSRTGLRVEFFQNRSLPETFTVAEASMPLNVRVQLVWQRGGVAGLKIINGGSQAG